MWREKERERGGSRGPGRCRFVHTVGGQTLRDTELRVVRPPRRGKLYTAAMVGISSAPALLFSSHKLTNPKAAEEVALITESLAVTT